MASFEILCVTMNQKDFSKIEEMNIHSNVVFANQADYTDFKEIDNNGHYARMITTDTRGVGKNRNMALIYASADICLFADDDVVYCDDVEKKVLGEFETHPDADVVVFYLDTDDFDRKQVRYNKTSKCGRFMRAPWGGSRLAVRLSSVKKANVWFTTLYGGGCVFPSGEDSMWINEARRKGLVFYTSKETIGKVSFDSSTWFTGYDNKFFYAKGAYYQNIYPKTIYLWMFYFALRTRKMGNLSVKDKFKWMQNGRKGYRQMMNFEMFCERM